MCTDPLVSIVIPAYNKELFIERTIRSALRQTYGNLEICIIDDGSTDTTRALAERLVAGDTRARIISVPNGGLARARNLGIEESRGAFVAFLDADDLWHPRKIELQVAALTKDSADDAAAAYALYRLIDENDRVLGIVDIVCNGYAFARMLYVDFVGNGSSLLVRRETALAIGGFDPSLDSCEDLDFELKLTARHRIVTPPYFLVGYRVYQGNMSSNRLRMARALVATIEHHIGRNPQLPRWAAAKARGSTSEWAFHWLLSDRHLKLAFFEFVRLFRNDAQRGIDLATRLVARKIRKTLFGAERQNVVDRDLPPFDFLSADSTGGFRCEFPRPRDVRNMKRLARADDRLAKNLGLSQHGLNREERQSVFSPSRVK